MRGVVKHIPVLGCGDSLLGGFVGFFEAWLIWVIVLFFVGNFLHDIQATIQTGKTLIPGLNITVQQYQVWHDAYNQAVHNSLFAQGQRLFY